ncbi:MAG TPA: NAD-dependent epimerase/dehydratase family protein, partial [Anaeromyxobacteraceae bacterium]|nr:NAD-dependent epimerase/dehydratase family protein [Anaeromyxobacteraceae bacterium]
MSLGVRKRKVGVLGATGMVGQRFVSLLAEHPWFEVVTVAASASSAGKTYADAVAGRWALSTPVPERVAKLTVGNASDVQRIAGEVDLVFCAVDMPKDETARLEEAYAKAETPVVSNNSAHRGTPDVPMMIPEVNPEHAGVV